MIFKKYQKAIQLFLICEIFLVVICMIFAFSVRGSFSPFIPTDNIGIEFMIVFIVLFPLSAIIGIVLGTYLLAPLFIFVHKATVGRKCDYGIEERPEEEGFTKTYRGFFAALMAINFSLIIALNLNVSNIILDEAENGAPLVFVFMLIFTIGISTLLFAPVWSLLDAGIMYSNKEKRKDSDQPVEVRSVGGFYMYLLKGYAGIGVIVTFYQFFASLIFAELAEGADASVGDIISTSILLVPFPFLITFAAIPSIVIFDIFRKHRIFFVRKIARIYGIKDVFNIDLEILKAEATNEFKN